MISTYSWEAGRGGVIDIPEQETEALETSSEQPIQESTEITE